MGKYVYALVIAGFILLVGLAMFPSIKNMFGYNSTAGFSDLLNAMYTGLPYALVFFIGFAAWLASRKRS